MDKKLVDAICNAITDSFISPNVSDDNLEPANVVDALAQIADAINNLADAIRGTKQG